jgi:tRNA(Ile)-lysidine synthase
MAAGGPAFDAFAFGTRRSVVAAVSGGGDSIALLILLKEHLARRSAATRIVAATVDHGLRPGARAEAEAVAALCGRIGIEHRVVSWTGVKPTNGLQAAAREARHRLLAEIAVGEGTDICVTGHNRGDQVETVLMRQARGKGIGEAGVAPATLVDGKVWFVRPLLGVERAELRRWLGERGVGWAEDPSNLDRRFERVRMRESLDEADGEARARAALEAAARAAIERRRLAEGAAGILGRHASLVAPGLFLLARGALREDRDALVHALRGLLATVGGRSRLADHERVAALASALDGGPMRATLSGTAIDARDSAIYLHRELRGGSLSSMTVATGSVWDGRYIVDAEDGGARVNARRGKGCGRDGDAPDAPRGLLRAASAAEPAGPNGGRLRRVVGPFHHYLPSFDFAFANALARVAGAAAFPDPPFEPAPSPGHNPTYALP